MKKVIVWVCWLLLIGLGIAGLMEAEWNLQAQDNAHRWHYGSVSSGIFDKPSGLNVRLPWNHISDYAIVVVDFDAYPKHFYVEELNFRPSPTESFSAYLPAKVSLDLPPFLTGVSIWVGCAWALLYWSRRKSAKEYFAERLRQADREMFGNERHS